MAGIDPVDDVPRPFDDESTAQGAQDLGRMHFEVAVLLVGVFWEQAAVLVHLEEARTQSSVGGEHQPASRGTIGEFPVSLPFGVRTHLVLREALRTAQPVGVEGVPDCDEGTQAETGGLDEVPELEFASTVPGVNWHRMLLKARQGRSSWCNLQYRHFRGILFRVE